MILMAAGQDLSEMVESITWSGDTKQVARTLSFTLASRDTDPYLPAVTLDEAAPVVLQADDRTDLFWGHVFEIDKTAAGSVTTYLAYDKLFYLLSSDIGRTFDGTPESITQQVCKELEVPLASAAETGINVYYPCLGKSGYEAILAPYTEASRQNGKKYIPLMDKDALRVIEKGQPSGVILDGGYNLIDASYKTSLTALVNRVVIVDANGNRVDAVEDAESRSRYGTIQKVYKQEEGKDAQTMARNLFQQINQSASCQAVSDYRCRAGYSVYIREPVTGLIGRFYVENDTHTFKNASETMQLTLAFDCVMDEKETGTQNGGSADE